MTQIATYNQARSLAHALRQFGINVKPETFDMKTSGIYIPRWIGYSRIPHEFDPTTGVARWYFFLRFEDGHPDVNVGEALDFSGLNGMKKLAMKIAPHIHLA
jgi:hypothetical protein